MASWTIRFHDKWPHLSTLYTSTHNLDEAGKNPDPLMGIDNVFDPNEPYGADRYYVQPRSEMSIEEPSYIRGVYKDDESRSRSSDFVIRGGLKRGSACRIILCIFLVMSFIGVVLAAITLAVILSQHNVTRRWPAPMEFDSEMTLNGANFTYKLRDNTSEEFKALEKTFCSALHELFLADDSPIQSDWTGCEVLEFSNGSVVTRFRIFVRPREKADREGMRSMEEQLITYLTNKLNDDGPWKPLKINLNSIKDFVKVDKTGGMAVKPSINITTPTSGTTTTITSTTTSTMDKAVITTKEIVNTSPKILIISEGIANKHPSTPSTTTDAFTQDLVSIKRTMDVSMKSVTTAGVITEARGVSSTATASTATTSTVTGDYVGKFSTVTTEMHTAQPSQVVSTTGRATSAVFTKGLLEVISTGLALNITDAATKRTTTFTTERTSTELDTTLSTTLSPVRSIVSTDTRTFVSTLTTPIPKFDSAEKSTIKTLSEGTRKLVTARTEGTTTSFGETVTTEGAVAFENISTQQEITTSKLLSTTSSSSENATEIATDLDLISTSIPMTLVSNAEPLGISRTAFTDVYTLSTDLGLVSANENTTTSSSKKLSFVEDGTLLLKTTLSSTALPTDSIVLNEGSTIDTSAHSAVFLTTLSTEISSITDLEPNNSAITETATTSQSNGTVDSTKVPVNTPTGIVPSETPSVIDGTMVSPDVAVSTYANLNVSEAVSRETSADVNATHHEMEFTTLTLKVSTEATKMSTVEVSTNTTLSDAFSNVSDLILANASLNLSTTLERRTNFVGTTISSNITAKTDVDITASSVDNPTTKIQAEISKMIISTESVEVSSVAEVIITESTQQQESVSQQPDNLTLGMVQKSTTVPSNETSDQPEINVTLALLSTHVLEDVTTPEPVASSTQSLGIISTPFFATDTVSMEVTSSGIAITGELSPSTSTIPSIITSEVTRKTEITEVDRPTITSTAEYNYTSIDGTLSNISTGPIYNETIVSPLAEKEIASNITAERTVKITTLPPLHSTTERMAASSVSHSVKQTTEIITIGINNSSIGTPKSDSSRISTDQGLVDDISPVKGNLSNVSSGPIYNETTNSPWVGKEIVSNISAEITDQNVIVPQVQTTTERMATASVSHSARQTTEIITTEIFNLVFGTSQSSSSLTSTDQGDGILSVDENFNVSSGPVHNETTESVSNIFATYQNVTVPHVQTTTEGMAASAVSHSERQTAQITTIETINSVFGTSQTSTDQGLFDGISSVDENLNVSSGPIYNETADSPLAGREIVSNISAEITDQNVTVPQVQTKTEGMTASSVSHSERQTTIIITTETINSVFGTSQSNSSQISTDQGLFDGISSIDANFNVSSGPISNETTDSPLTGREIVSNISAGITDQNVTVPQIQATTEVMTASSVSHSERQTTTIITTETINSVFGTLQSNSPQTSADQGLFDGISSVEANFNVSSGPISNETTDSPLTGREIVSNISAEITDQNVTVSQIQTATEVMTASSVSHSERQTTTTIMTETINSVFGRSQSNSSQTSTNQSLVDGISSVDEYFNVSSKPVYNETTDSPLAEKEIVSNISPEIADQNVTVPQLQTTTERMATPSISHSAKQTTVNIATGTNNSTISTLNSNLSLTSTDQGIVDGISSASVIEEGFLSGLTESRSQQPPTVAYVNKLNATAITTVEIINFTTEPQPLVSENVSEGDPFSNNRNSNALNTFIDIISNANDTFPISSDTTPLNKGATNPVVTDVTTEKPKNTETSSITILSAVSDSVNISKLASESITSNDLWEMTTVAVNTIVMDNQTETALTNAMTNSVNVTESITDTNLTSNLANTTENSLYNETVNVNVTEITPYILISTNKYKKETESGTLNVDLRDNGTSPASWNTSDNLVNTNGVTLDTVTLNDTINSTDANNVTFLSLSHVEDSTLSISANESVSNVTFVSNININSSDERTGNILTNTNVTSTPKSNTTESEPLM